MNVEKNFPAPIRERSDEALSESLKAAMAEVERLNSLIPAQSEARRQFVEAAQ